MGKGAFRKVSWTWTTRQGGKRIPRRLLAVKLVPMPKERKIRKLRRISPASPKPEKQPRTEAAIVTGQGRAVAAPKPEKFRHAPNAQDMGRQI